ncbi:MAG: hypothetical protein NTY53_23620 [Kiritimatiellaeota bacterium]|nr:hypothetical protein [Kiritimatiellota bacterium]
MNTNTNAGAGQWQNEPPIVTGLTITLPADIHKLRERVEQDAMKERAYRRNPDAQRGERDADAYYLLGCCYASGVGTPFSLREAFRCWKQAVAIGHRNANTLLGLCYLYGWGVPQDTTKSVEQMLYVSAGGDTRAEAVTLQVRMRAARMSGDPERQKEVEQACRHFLKIHVGGRWSQSAA